MHDAGRDVPAIENKPSLTGWGWLWDAFWTLGTCRSVGMSAGPIPWTAVQRYAEVDEMSPMETYLLHQVVRHLDGRLLDHHRKQSQTKPGAAQAGIKQNRRPNRGARG